VLIWLLREWIEEGINMVKGLLFGLLGVVLLLSIGVVSATSLQTDVNEQLIIRSSCSGSDAVSEIMIFDSANELYVPRTLMTSISPSDFVFTTSFWYEDTFRAEIECIFSDGFHSFETVLIDVTTQNNMILPSSKIGYDYEALLDYNVFFKSDATSIEPILFEIDDNAISFQPADLSLSGSTIVGCINKSVKVNDKRVKEDEKIAQQRAREDKKLEQQRAREDAQLKKQRDKEDKELAKNYCKKNSSETRSIILSQAPLNGGAFVENNKFTYTGVYGLGLDLEYRVNNDYVKEELVISSIDALPKATGLSGDVTLSLNSLMTTSNNIIVDGMVWDMVKPITTSNTILLQDDSGKTIYQLEIPVAFDSSGEKVIGTYTLTNMPSGIGVSVQMPYSWFVDPARVYPVLLDPTVVWDGTSNLNGAIPTIVVTNVTIPVDVPYTLTEIISWGNETIVDAECELDIIDDVTQVKVVDFRSFYNNQGIMEFTWTPPYVGNFGLE
jgi:hypothetical protein